MKDKSFILWFEELGIEDVPLVGGKNASLGEMYCELGKKGIPIPNGFAVTAYAYRYFLQSTGIEKELRAILKNINPKNTRQLAEKGQQARELLKSVDLPSELKRAIIEAYHKLSIQFKTENTDVAVRSSATAEDLPDASFAGQQETYLNVKGEQHLIDSCKKCFASLFTNRALAYREERNYDHMKVALSIGVQKMVRSDLASSGIMFTIDTESGFKEAILINAAWGLGENVVQGAVTPDEYLIFKPTLAKGYKPIISKKIGNKEIRMVYSNEGNASTKNLSVSKEEQEKIVLNDEEILQIARWGVIIEEHYTKKKGHWTPMDTEWAKDGQTGKIFIVQARPETVQSRKDRNIIEEYQLKKRGKILATGRSIGNKIGIGTAQIIRDVKNIEKFKPGDVLITEMTDPDWVVIMKQASAIVTNRGGRACHAAIVSRELGIPAIVGTVNGTEKITSGKTVTISCAEGDEGYVYEGKLKYSVKETSIRNLPQTKTKIMMNLGEPDQAFEQSFLPVQGVGLAREEFIINSEIKIHPLALVHYDKLAEEVKKQIEALTKNYDDKKQFFIDKLAQGVGMLASAFYPNDVIVRLSDFKSNEYANLIGGHLFEPKEDNPMIGWRGASRYYDDKYREAFALECKALLKAREEFGLHNIKIMVPFCRTVEEGKKVISELSKNGLKQHQNHLEIYVMCEIPANVILAEQFAKIFDGFSIGTNDLTQLTLGIDRDSELVAHIYDERNDAVKALVSHIIAVAKEKGKKVGICGEAPSTYPDFAEFLVQCGIDSISLSPDAVIKTILNIAKVEKEMKKK